LSKILDLIEPHNRYNLDLIRNQNQTPFERYFIVDEKESIIENNARNSLVYLNTTTVLTKPQAGL
jgi:hypothetical protein